MKASVIFLVTSTRWLLTSASASSSSSALIESTCSSGDTDWNSASNVSENLRLWIESVKVKAGNGDFAVNFYDDEDQTRDEP